MHYNINIHSNTLFKYNIDQLLFYQSAVQIYFLRFVGSGRSILCLRNVLIFQKLLYFIVQLYFVILIICILNRGKRQAKQKSMKSQSSNTYLLELNVKKGKINISQKGTVGLLLRAGRSQSSVSEQRPIIRGVVNFNTQIKLNVDQSALDTQRCSLTLNFVSQENAKRVIGIVVINLPSVGEEISKTFKITSTPDKDAEIQLSIIIRQLDENRRPVEEKISSLHTNKSTNKSTFGQMLLTNSNRRFEEKPTSPPSDSQNKLKLKSKISESNVVEDLQNKLAKVQQEKQLLKKLLKLEMNKNKTAYVYINKIIEILQNGSANVTDFSKLGLSETILKANFSSDLSTSMKKLQSDTAGSRNPFTAIGGPPLDIVKEDNSLKHQISNQKVKQISNILQNKSQLSGSGGSQMSETLKNFKKIFQNSIVSKRQLKQMFDKIQSQPQIQVDAIKIRNIKTKMDKSYVNLLGKTSWNKEDLFKHKNQINKIMDQLLVSKN